MQAKPHVIIIGSGLGGLLCGAILSRSGFRITVFEANRQIGGNLQVYVRDRQLFDASVHYIGGVKPGQNLHSVFQYLGILDKLHLEELDQDGFDRIVFHDDPREYSHASTSDRFVHQLVSHFPEEEDNLKRYIRFVEETCASFPLFNLRNGDPSEKLPYLNLNARDTIASFTSDRKLQSVLAGSNLLYAGEGVSTPFHVHALTTYSYIQSAFRFKKGSSMLAKALKDLIVENEGEVKTKAMVKEIIVKNGVAKGVELQTGKMEECDFVISNAHPAKTLEMIDPSEIRQVYANRIRSLENTVAPFMVNLTYSDEAIPYKYHNHYGFVSEDVWNCTRVKGGDWPRAYGIFYAPHRKSGAFAQGVSILTYMPFEELSEWSGSFNSVTFPGERGASYDNFKRQAEQQLVSTVAERFPDLVKKRKNISSATPLSYRDYLLNGDGNMYGILKNYQDPIRTQISPRLKIPNVFLTGQNLNLHGVTGVCMSALLTCGCFIDLDLLLQNIRSANG